MIHGVHAKYNINDVPAVIYTAVLQLHFFPTVNGIIGDSYEVILEQNLRPPFLRFAPSPVPRVRAACRGRDLILNVVSSRSAVDFQAMNCGSDVSQR